MSVTSGIPSNLPAETAKKVSNGASEGTTLLQSSEQAAFQSISGTYAQAEIEALRDALVSAGIMKAS